MANFANDSTDRLREMRTKGGEGVQNPGNFADVLYEWSLTAVTNFTKPRTSHFFDLCRDRRVGLSQCDLKNGQTKTRSRLVMCWDSGLCRAQDVRMLQAS